MERIIMVSCVDVCSDFDPIDNYYVKILLNIYSQLEFVTDPSKADILVCSVFGNEKDKYPEKKKIFWLAEHPNRYRLPEDSPNTIKLCSEYRSVFNSFRVPYWAVLFEDWVGNTSDHKYVGYTVDGVFNHFKHRNLEELSSRKRFCGMMYSNPQGGRVEMFRKIHERGLVICSWGPLYKNMEETIPIKDFQKKLDAIRTCKFYLAFENSKYPGYHTEKIISAYLGDAVPVYWGDETIVKDLNPKAFINCNDFESLDEVLDYMVHLDSHPEEYCEFLKHSLFTSLDSVMEYSPASIAKAIQPIVKRWFEDESKSKPLVTLFPETLKS